MVGDGGFNLAQTAYTLHHALIQFAQKIQLVLLQLSIRFSTGYVGNGSVTVFEYAGLISCRQEAVGETAQSPWRNKASVEHDKTG